MFAGQTYWQRVPSPVLEYYFVKISLPARVIRSV